MKLNSEKSQFQANLDYMRPLKNNNNKKKPNVAHMKISRQKYTVRVC